MTTTRQDIFEMIERLENLKKQATVERRHFYSGKVTTDAIAFLYKIAAEHYVE